MSQSDDDWNKASKQGNRGIHVYIGKAELDELAEDGVLDLDKEIRYKASTAVSCDRGRAIVELDNPGE